MEGVVYLNNRFERLNPRVNMKDYSEFFQKLSTDDWSGYEPPDLAII